MRRFSVIVLMFISSHLFAQKQSETLSVFFDCSNYGSNCYFDFIRQQMNKINFVRDRMDADVQVLAKSNWNDNGTLLTTFFVIGRNKFSNIQDTLNFSTPAGSTDDVSRQIIEKNLKIALLPFISKTNLADNISINLKKTETEEIDSAKKNEKDPYNFWVFQLGANGSTDGNKNYKNVYVSGYINAVRETEITKTVYSISINEQYSKYIDSNSVYKYEFQDFNFGYNYFKRFQNHYAIGVNAGFINSKYSNMKSQIYGGPGIEYSIFPYKQFTNKRWVFEYDIFAKNNNYYDTTIYLKTKEFYFTHKIGSIFSYTQPWGSVNVGVFWNNLLSDFYKNNLSFNGAVVTKIAKGLNFAIWGNYSFVRNQINIAKGDIPLDQLLIKNREILSDYNYSIGCGISYRFGSKSNDAVNPAFKGLNYSINL